MAKAEEDILLRAIIDCLIELGPTDAKEIAVIVSLKTTKSIDDIFKEIDFLIEEQLVYFYDDGTLYLLPEHSDTLNAVVTIEDIKMDNVIETYHNELKIVQIRLEDGSELLVWKSALGGTRIQIINSETKERSELSIDSSIEFIKILDDQNLVFKHR